MQARCKMQNEEIFATALSKRLTDISYTPAWSCRVSICYVNSKALAFRSKYIVRSSEFSLSITQLETTNLDRQYFYRKSSKFATEHLALEIICSFLSFRSGCSFWILFEVSGFYFSVNMVVLCSGGRGQLACFAVRMIRAIAT